MGELLQLLGGTRWGVQVGRGWVGDGGWTWSGAGGVPTGAVGGRRHRGRDMGVGGRPTRGLARRADGPAGARDPAPNGRHPDDQHPAPRPEGPRVRADPVPTRRRADGLLRRAQVARRRVGTEPGASWMARRLMRHPAPATVSGPRRWVRGTDLGLGAHVSVGGCARTMKFCCHDHGVGGSTSRGSIHPAPAGWLLTMNPPLETHVAVGPRVRADPVPTRRRADGPAPAGAVARRRVGQDPAPDGRHADDPHPAPRP